MVTICTTCQSIRELCVTRLYDSDNNTDYFPVQLQPIDVCNGDGVCLLLSRGALFVRSLYECRPVTAEARPRSRTSPCENSGGHSRKGTGFSCNNSAFPLSVLSQPDLGLSIIPPVFHIGLDLNSIVSRETGGASLETFKQNCALSCIGEQGT